MRLDGKSVVVVRILFYSLCVLGAFYLGYRVLTAASWVRVCALILLAIWMASTDRD